MKLINKTKVSDETLLSVLSDAARSLNKRLRTTNVIVQVTYNRVSKNTCGMAYHCCKVRWDKRWRTTDGGAFKISIPCFSLTHSIFELDAERFFNTARHEWGHIADFQHKGLEFDERVHGRRKAHDYRPEEKRVYEYLEQAKRKGITAETFADSILNLAIEIEEKYSTIV